MERVVVTGATSFIGIALIKKLIEQNVEVLAIIRPGSSRAALLSNKKNLNIIEKELAELQEIDIDENYDIFFHIGWSSDFENPRDNLLGQLKNVTYNENAVKLAHKLGCKVFLSVGSQAECGIVNGCITAETSDSPKTAYAIAKVVAYNKCLALCETFGMKLCWPRLLSAYGVYDRDHTLVMSCIKAGIDNREMDMTRAEQIWDFVYVDDVADCLWLISKKGRHGKRYPIGSGIGKSLKSYIYDIARLTKSENLIKGIGKKEYVKGQIMNLVADITELTIDTGWKPQTTFEDGIRQIIYQNKINHD